MNILITGATGLLGRALIDTKKPSHKVAGVYLGKYGMANGPDITYYPADVQDRGALEAVFLAKKIDAVIHTAGAADVDFCERHYDLAYRSNVLGTKNIVELCEKAKAKLVYISTNAVFDGEHAPYGENDKVNPINKYGAMKLDCEIMVKKALEDNIIVRPILMYGWNHEGERKNLVTALIDSLGSGKDVNMVVDVYDNPLCAYNCAEAIWSLLEMDKKGTYHIAGRDIVSRYDYALLIADVFGLDARLIKPVDSSFFPNIAPRPKNTSYRTEKIESEIGFVSLGLREGLLSMKAMRKERCGKGA
ncbi:MAG: SDR family oxidoreductase [Candidatus Omnitrophica bacterium]|nr:SDR family oxidoreductase [Candidatus Omnitrophota bacterium]